MRYAILALLAGCTFPTKHGDRFVCSGTPVPTSAPPTISITLHVLDPVTEQPLMSQITAVSGGLTLIDNVATDADGLLTKTIMTLGAPLDDVFVRSTVGPPYVDSFVYSPVQVTSDVDTQIEQFTAALLLQLQVTDGTTPAMIVAVVDCNGDAVEGATATVDGASVVYLKDGKPNPMVTATDSTGIAYVLGLTDETPRMVGASLSGVQFLSHMVTPHMASMTIADVSP
jgi:hypothetical protein